MSDTTESLERDLEQDRNHLRETLGAIEEKMSPGRMLDEAMAYFNTGPKEFASTLTGQVRDNPLPVLLTSVGLAWLILGDKKSGNGSAPSQPAASTSTAFASDDYEAWMAHDQLQNAEWVCVRSDDETVDAYGLRLDQTRASALGLQADPDEDAHSFSDRVKGAADAVRSRGVVARDKLKHGVSGAAHGIGSAVSSAGAVASDAKQRASDGGQAAIAGMKHLHATNPMATAAIGVAIGAVFGATLPVSRKEKDALAPLAEKGLEKGAELGRSAAEKVSNALDMNGGRQTAETQGSSSAAM